MKRKTKSKIKLTVTIFQSSTSEERAFWDGELRVALAKGQVPKRAGMVADQALLVRRARFNQPDVPVLSGYDSDAYGDDD